MRWRISSWFWLLIQANFHLKELYFTDRKDIPSNISPSKILPFSNTKAEVLWIISWPVLVDHWNVTMTYSKKIFAGYSYYTLNFEKWYCELTCDSTILQRSFQSIISKVTWTVCSSNSIAFQPANAILVVFGQLFVKYPACTLSLIFRRQMSFS